ncbi:replication-associated recombination protein A [bacterium]|nr:MAG: replication-associated recombination protein A [bacterium]
MDLFEEKSPQASKDLPLAARMRPKTLDEFTGQRHIIAPGKLLRRAIEADRLASLILYGPPGSGKTSLAYCVSSVTKAEFASLNATTSNVDELRKVILRAKQLKNLSGKKTILFIDEIHRFNKAQQDCLLPDVEEANVILIGATVHNPFFALLAPLLSRSLVFELKPLSVDEIMVILNNAIKDKTRGLSSLKIKFQKGALEFLSKTSDGDARRALSALEVGALTTPKDKSGFINFDLAVAEESIQKKIVLYDRDEDAHYDTASAFIKSMRGSDPDAALYWLAKMLYAGEDPRFIARRICICAAEDVGNADPQALVLANAALQISEFVGLPECRIPLAQTAVYVACAPKSNAAYLGIEKAAEDVENGRLLEVPEHLKDAHSFPGHHVKQEYLPASRQVFPSQARYYQPADIGYEAKIKARLENLRRK